MIGEYREIKCPFCSKGRIQCLHVIGHCSEMFTDGANSDGVERGNGSRQAKSALARGGCLEVHSGCEECGMAREDIEKKLRADGLA